MEIGRVCAPVRTFAKGRRQCATSHKTSHRGSVLCGKVEKTGGEGGGR